MRSGRVELALTSDCFVGEDPAACSSCAAASVPAAQRSVADGRVQEQEQLQRRALVAGAAGRGRLVNFL